MYDRLNSCEVYGARNRARECFGSYFSKKIATNVGKTTVDSAGVYNGKRKLIVQNRNFMTRSDVEACMMDLKNKKSEGFARIPVCCLLDAREPLLNPMADILCFNTITQPPALLT